jgi:hypothetical protein
MRDGTTEFVAMRPSRSLGLCKATIRPDDATDLGANARSADGYLALVVLATTDQGRNELLLWTMARSGV